MFIEAKYLGMKNGENECFINTDFLVDVFVDKANRNKMIGYTLDEECNGYEMDREEFEEFMENERLIMENSNCVENA